MSSSNRGGKRVYVWSLIGTGAIMDALDVIRVCVHTISGQFRS